MGVCCFVDSSGAIHGGISIVVIFLSQQCYRMQPPTPVGSGESLGRRSVCCFVDSSGAIHSRVSVVLIFLSQQCYRMQPSSPVGSGESLF